MNMISITIQLKLIIKRIFVTVKALDVVQCDSFITWADDRMLDEGWSPDVVVGRVKKEKLFSSNLMPSTSTLYNWIDRGIKKTRNIDLLEKSIPKATK